MEFTINRLQSMKSRLHTNPTDEEAGKALNKLSINDEYFDYIFNYGADGIDDADASIQTVKDRMEDEDDPDNPSRKDDVDAEKDIISDIKAEPKAYWIGGGIDEPVDAETAEQIIGHIIEAKKH